MSTALIIAEPKARKEPRRRNRVTPLAADAADGSDGEIRAENHGLQARIFDAEARRALIEEDAYHRAASRGFEPGHELEDWLAAEAEIDARLCGEMHPQ